MLMQEIGGGVNIKMCLEDSVDTKEEMKGKLGPKNKGKLVIFLDTGMPE